MIELKQTETFRKWWQRLADERARGAIFARLDRLAYGHAGDVAPMGEGVSELRIHGACPRADRKVGPVGPRLPRLFPEPGQHDHRPAVRRRQEHPGARHPQGPASGTGMERMTWPRD